MMMAWRGPELCARVIGLAASDHGGAFAWLDGGDERGWLGIDADLAVAADSLRSLPAIEALWRAEPQFVWIGHITYDLGADLLLGRAPRVGRLPGLSLRRYRAALELGTRSRLHGDAQAGARLMRRLTEAPVLKDMSLGTWPLGQVAARWRATEYRAKVDAVRAFIAAGETYQVNLSQAFAAPWREAWRRRPLATRAAAVYAALRGATPATMGALLAGAEGKGPPLWVVSNSPETLVSVELGAGVGGGDLARSWPIKGTRARGGDPPSDMAAAAELLASEKDLAEHVMIVDLVRSDLGRVAVPGTVEAPRRPTLVSLPTVHHLVSEVRCTLRPGWGLTDLLAAVFPGGSITGAPKRRTVEIIDDLEQRRRGLYCGAIVALMPGGLRCSIPIRTGELDETGLTLQSGGGIVIDSDPEAERLETWAKVRAFDRG
jgi:para-aminobenzoate synthetase component 1